MAVLTREAAAEVLSHLLSTLEYPPQERHRRRYGSLVEGSETSLQTYLFSCIRPSVFDTFEQPTLPSWASLKKLNETEPPPPDAPGIYLNIIRGTDGHDRLYVGQTSRLNQRIFRQHMNFRYRRDNRSLHYHAMEHSSWNNFVVLAVLPPPAGSLPPWLRGGGPALVLNILEMWCALMFKSLPPSTLDEWLPEKHAEADKPRWHTLNLALPLDQGDQEYGASEDWGDRLRKSNDPLARGYASRHVLKPMPVLVRHEPAAEPKQVLFGASGVALFAFATGFVAGAYWQKR